MLVLVISLRKNSVLACRRARNSSVSLANSMALIAPPATAGANELENKYGRERCRRSSIISRRPLVYPPLAPPNALPSVLVVITSIRSMQS